MANRKGIVYDTVTKKVLYKFDTPTLPTLQANQDIKERSDADSIEVNADYNQADDTYVNPISPPPKNWKAEYAALTTDSQRIAKIAEYLGLV